jgi:hypothetical protein
VYRVACLLLVIATVISPAAATTPTVPADDAPAQTAGNGTATATATPDRTVNASDETFGGFTLGAAILAVVVAGSYRYLRG